MVLTVYFHGCKYLNENMFKYYNQSELQNIFITRNSFLIILTNLLKNFFLNYTKEMTGKVSH